MKVSVFRHNHQSGRASHCRYDTQSLGKHILRADKQYRAASSRKKSGHSHMSPKRLLLAANTFSYFHENSPDWKTAGSVRSRPQACFRQCSGTFHRICATVFGSRKSCLLNPSGRSLHQSQDCSHISHNPRRHPLRCTDSASQRPLYFLPLLDDAGIHQQLPAVRQCHCIS